MFAYVDPGTISALYQVIYIAVLGAAAAVIFKPWGYAKATFLRLAGRRPAKSSPPTAPPDPARPDDGNR